MIVFDTNVLSEPLRPTPDASVVAWMRRQADVAVTTVTVAELLVGARRLPDGIRRVKLIAAIESILTGSRILPFDEAAAREYARMQDVRRRGGTPLAVEDGMIAAIASCHGASLATRNTSDFVDLGIELINPWD